MNCLIGSSLAPKKVSGSAFSVVQKWIQNEFLNNANVCMTRGSFLVLEPVCSARHLNALEKDGKGIFPGMKARQSSNVLE